MIRRDFLKRMAFAALACGMLGSEILRRREWEPLPEGRVWIRATLDADTGKSVGFFSRDGVEWVPTEDVWMVREDGKVLIGCGGDDFLDMSPYCRAPSTEPLDIRADVEFA